eukprot:6921693-Pyramimonas_sp.AAC.1
MAQVVTSSSVQALGCPRASTASKTLARAPSENSSGTLRQPFNSAPMCSPARKRSVSPSPRS